MKKYYLNKEVFKHSELSMKEVRLLVLLTSSKITVKDLTYNDKLWIVKNKTYIKEIDGYVSKLVSLGLLDENGKGLILKNNTSSIILDNIDMLTNSKTLRQLFCCVAPIWTNKKFKEIYLTKEVFYNLFGNNTREINQNIKRSQSVSDIILKWEIDGNKIKVTYETNNCKKQNVGKTKSNNTTKINKTNTTTEDETMELINMANDKDFDIESVKVESVKDVDVVRAELTNTNKFDSVKEDIESVKANDVVEDNDVEGKVPNPHDIKSDCEVVKVKSKSSLNINEFKDCL